ncbi:hypothetical protein [Circovirus-like genome DCCV-9]|uniref:hypothetical protein n=1 Tax=Circovirus-like genome DCCV-9 TaxID=1788449 RepID=UPI0007F99E4C|nr:hypothetical protein [Circovirus-like genome DCCV-9]AMB42980.1 hypothetical protein [Circovirus-like genome DCCV-9]
MVTKSAYIKKGSRLAKARARPYKKSKASKTFAKKVKAVVMKTVETKSRPWGYGKLELNHNVPYAITLNGTGNPGPMPPQGTQDYERIGDIINTSGIKLRLMCGQKADRPNVTFKFWVVQVPKGSGYSYNQWFMNYTGNCLLDSINTDFVKILATHTWKAPETYSAETREVTFTKQWWIPRRRVVKFGPTNASLSHNDSDVHLLCAAYDAYGTLVTDNIAYVQLHVETFYRDP